MACSIHEFRIHLHLVLVDHVDTSVLQLSGRSVRHVDVAIIVTERDENSHLSIWFRSQIKGCQHHCSVGVPNVRIRDLDHVLLGHPTELVQVPQPIVEAGHIWVVAHPVKRVAVGQAVGSSMQQPEIVSELVHCHHHFEVVADCFTSIAHAALLAHPSNSLRAGWGHLRGDGVHQVVVVKPVGGPILAVPCQRLTGTVVQTGERPAVRLVSLTIASVANDLGDDGDIQVVLTIGHSLERLTNAGKYLTLVVLDRIVVLL
mmetsp:Transcript_52835/g.140484  ORF Transcript_52835/g.140484 Transcript_52835/m.140484 type:complete len:259 (-) Transcript_52835:1339-2115(-)